MTIEACAGGTTTPLQSCQLFGRQWLRLSGWQLTGRNGIGPEIKINETFAARLAGPNTMIDRHAVRNPKKIEINIKISSIRSVVLGNSVGGVGRILCVCRTKITNLGCSINRFSKGDASILIGPIEVKHGGGVTYQDSSIRTTEPCPVLLPPLLSLDSLLHGDNADGGAYRDWLID